MTSLKRIIVVATLALLAAAMIIMLTAASTDDIRRRPDVRRAMAAYHESHPACEWCNRDRSVQTHHTMQISLHPEFAADTNVMVSLCGGLGGRCHLWVGHAGDYQTSVTNIKQLIAVRAIERSTR